MLPPMSEPPFTPCAEWRRHTPAWRDAACAQRLASFTPLAHELWRHRRHDASADVYERFIAQARATYIAMLRRHAAYAAHFAS